jgi:hypothetical protein
VFISCLIYLFMKRRMIGFQNASQAYPYYEGGKKVLFITNIMFISIFLYSIFSVIFRPELYSRPFEYFISISILVPLIAIEIFSTPVFKKYIVLTLIKILLLIINLTYSLQLIYPGLAGIDPWWHQNFTIIMLKAGRIPVGYAYSELPMFHLIVSSIILITGFNYKFSAMLFTSSINIASLIFIFLIGKFIFNEKIGLLTALIAGIAEWDI